MLSFFKVWIKYFFERNKNEDKSNTRIMQNLIVFHYSLAINEGLWVFSMLFDWKK